MKTAGDLPVRPSTDPDHPPGTNIRTTPGGHEIVELPYAPLPPEAYRITHPEPEPETPREEPVSEEPPPF